MTLFVYLIFCNVYCVITSIKYMTIIAQCMLADILFIGNYFFFIHIRSLSRYYMIMALKLFFLLIAFKTKIVFISMV